MYNGVGMMKRSDCYTIGIVRERQWNVHDADVMGVMEDLLSIVIDGGTYLCNFQNGTSAQNAFSGLAVCVKLTTSKLILPN